MPENDQDGSIFNKLVIGFRLAYHDSYLFLAYIAGFLARGGSVIVTVYITLWVNKYFTTRNICSDLNITDDSLSNCNEELINIDKRTCPAAFTEASRISGITQTAALCFAPIFGALGDCVEQRKLLAGTALIGVLAYSATAAISDPTVALSNVIAICWGIAEIGMIVVAQFLVTKNMPAEHRGITNKIP